MKELIKIRKNNGKDAISAKELYEYLGYQKSHWAKWYRKNIEDNEFAVENVDYQTFALSVNGNDTKNFALSMDFSMKLAMLARTEKGEELRNYLIECEKKLRELTQYQLPQTFAQALRQLADKTEQAEQLQLQITEEAPLVNFAKALQISEHNILVGELAKILKQNGIDIGQNKLFIYLRDKGYLIKGGLQFNLPTQRAMELELFEVKRSAITNPNGSIRVTKTVMVRPKGQTYFINKLLKNNYHLLNN